MYSYQQPDLSGHFGKYGGSFVSETLTHAIEELKEAYEKYHNEPEFLKEFHYELKHFVGRPSPIYHAARMSRELGGAQIYLKREDLNHTGAHKINNTIGQAMLAKRMGKPRVIAETGAGQHGVATATICARYGLECVVYMGSEDVKRQSPNVYRMKLLGATVVPVSSGSKTLKDALNEALRDWVTNVENTFYIIGTVAGPHPYPGVLHGNRTYVLQDERGQITETHSISAGLDYPGVGPEHAYLKDIGRAQYVGATDEQALHAFHYLCRTEGSIPALESSHAIAYAMQLAPTMKPTQSILVNLSGRGDKDIGTVADLSNADFFCRPSCQGQGVKGGTTPIHFEKN